jgi:hypothetical protein
MALASTAVCLAALDALANTAPTVNYLGFVSLHTASPALTGANEATGGGYARQAETWNAASGTSPSCVKTNLGALSFTTTGVTANTHFGTWSLVTAGVYGLGGALTSSVTAVTITVAAGALSLGLT